MSEYESVWYKKYKECRIEYNEEACGQAAEMHQRDKADEYYRMTECIAYGTHYDMVCTYDAAVKHDSFGIVT